MTELNCASIGTKEPFKLRFTSDEWGNILLHKPTPWVITDRGIALEIRDPIRSRSVVQDGVWYNFRAHGLGHWANKEQISESLLIRLSKENSDMVCHTWADIVSEHAHRFDFKRFKRPFVRFSTEVRTVGVIWEYYAEIGRLGVYLGLDEKGLGGYITFLDEERFKILVQS